MQKFPCKEKASMELQTRVEQLERRCRRLTMALFAIVTIPITVAFVKANQATTQPIVRTENLEIVDSNGRVRAKLGKSDSESFALTIQTADGRPRISLLGSERGSAVNLFQGGQSIGATSMAAYQDSAGVTLRGANGALRAHLLVEGDRVRLGLWNADGKAVFTAPASGVASN
jgi:hypothetical protein